MHDGDMDRQQEFVLRTIEERDVRFIRLWFTDVLGILKSVAVAPAELEGAFAEGIGFDGSAIEGLTRVYEADMIAKPDPSTFQVLPWRGEHHGSARMFCDIETPDGEPSLADPRYVLKRALEKANAQGFTFYTHPEIEFYLFEPPADPDLPLVPVDSAGYFDHVPRGTAHDFRRATITMLESMGISVEFSHHEAGAEYQLSKVARNFIAGVLRHAAEITAVTNQYVNSYKRLWGGAEAPSYICWGHNNRSALIRVPMYKPAKGQSSRVEFRGLDSAANPYLAYAVLLAAGLTGIEKGYELPDGAEDDVWELTPAERRALGIEPLPSSLDEAVRVMEGSELVAETLGEHVFDFVLRNKRLEWEEYRSQVTPFELHRFLPVL